MGRIVISTEQSVLFKDSFARLTKMSDAPFEHYRTILMLSEHMNASYTGQLKAANFEAILEAL